MHVTLESIVQYATLGTLLSGLVSLVVWARIYRRQVNTQIFIEISARYAKLRSFPTGLWARPDPGQPLPERNEDFTAFVLQYLTISRQPPGSKESPSTGAHCCCEEVASRLIRNISERPEV